MKPEKIAALIVIACLCLAFGLTGHDDLKTREIAARNVPTAREALIKRQQEREEAAALALFEITLKRKDLK